MHSAVPQAIVAFVIALSLGVYVAVRHEKSSLHWLLLAVVGSIMLWSGAVPFRYTATTEEGLMRAFRVMFLGVYLLPPFWFLLAARFARVEAIESRPGVYPLLLLPSLLAYLTFFTNDSHRLFAREISLSAFVYGPVFWFFAAWCYACVLGGLAIYLRHALRMVANREPGRGILVALTALIPIVMNATYLSKALPWHHDPTAPSLAISLALLFAAVLRYRLLETLPLVRRDVIEHLPEGILIADPGGWLLDANPAAEALLGEGASRLRGWRLADVLAGLAAEERRAFVREALVAVGPDEDTRILEFRTRDGRELEMSAASVRGGHGEPTGRFVVLRDRTEARRFERFVRQSQRLDSVGSLVAGMAHEINNPLAFVRSNLMQLHRTAEFMKTRIDGLDPDEAQEVAELPQVVEETIDGVERITSLVERMRRLSRMSRDEVEDVDLNAVIVDAVRLAELHHSRSVRVELRLTDDLPRVRGSPDRLGQVVLNLLLNAKQVLAERPKGLIVAESHWGDGAVEVRIIDDGPGIPPEIRERIFDPFFTTRPPGEGTGLGLSIAFDIVREHGGALEVLSSSPEGTTFGIRLPLEPESAAR